jgi:predicted ATPase
MNRFDRIGITGYRRLMSVDVELRPLTVMIGPNGSGKTSLLEVFWLLAGSAEGKLNEQLSDLGGLASVLTRDKVEILEFNLRMTAQPAPLEYTLGISPRSAGYDIHTELLVQQMNPKASEPFKHIDSRGSDVRYSTPGTPGLLRPNWEHKPFESSLSQAPKMYREPETFRTCLASTSRYGALDVSSNSPVRLPQRMRPATTPGVNGEELVSCLYYLRETDPNRFEMVEDTLVAGFPDFERLSFPPVAAGTIAMTWKDRNFTTPLYMDQLSEGTLRFLWLVTLLQSHELGAITMIDEPEVSLHPGLLSLLADLMRETGDRTQLIIATHSDRLIRFLEPREVLVCDITEDGTSRMSWADAMNLDKWLADYSLDQLWTMNLVGG